MKITLTVKFPVYRLCWENKFCRTPAAECLFCCLSWWQ